MNNPVEISEIATWSPKITKADAERAAGLLESGKVLLLPKLDFPLTPGEHELLSPACADGKAKNISYDPATRNLRGSILTGHGHALLAGMVERFSLNARGLIASLLPGYAASLTNGLASYRPFEAEGRSTSATKDDTRLHVDAFASRPNRGARILRVFTNINPGNQPRVWEIGEPFEDIAARYSPHIAQQIPGSAWLLAALHVTKGRRSAYDHVMLKMHDHMKRDSAYQNNAPRVRIEFPPGSTWICFSDHVAHAALSGQFLLEQTFYLPVAAMRDERYAPLRVLEQLYQRQLV